MEGEPVIPAPEADDDDDVAWALQTAAVQWQRGQRADAVVWLRRAVDASISAGRAERTRSLTRLAASVADRLVSEALAVPDSKSPPSRADQDSDVDELLARSSAPPRASASSSPPRPAARSVTDIPVDIDEDIEDADIQDDDIDDFEDDYDEDGSPTLPPPQRHGAASVRSGARRPSATPEQDEYVDDGDTESIVDGSELLSERPGPSRPSEAPGSAHARSRASEGPSQTSRPAPRPAQGARPPQSSQPAPSARPPQSSQPAPSARPPQSSQPAPSARPSQSSRPPAGTVRLVQSSRPTQVSWPPKDPGVRPPSDRASAGAEPRNDRAAPRARPSNDRAPSNVRPSSDRPSDRATSSSRPPASTPSSDRARSPSDRPMEPIVTAEELFKQRALADARKAESEPPARSVTASPPPKPKTTPVPPAAIETAPSDPAPARSSAPEAAAGPPIVDGVALDVVRGLEDLPEEAQVALARSAVLTTLSTDEEVGSFGAALVTRGRVGIMPSIADVASSVAKPGEIVFTRGTLSEGVSLRVVALESQTVVATWSDETLQSAMADCPWVADELRLVADRFQSQAGAVLGPLGDRLDDTLRDLVLSRLEVRTFAPGEIVVEQGKTVPGLHIVGAGRVDLATSGGPVTEASPGQLLFGAEVLGAGKAHATARAGKTGTLILFAPRATAHELLLSVPPLIEMLAD